jgi:hypothetical protein
MGLNPTPITPTFPHAPRVIPDGRLSRVRLATMTIIAAFPVLRRFKRSPAFTPSSTGWLSSSMRARPNHVCRLGVLSGGPRVPVMTESSFALSRCYLSGSSVYRYLD